MENLDRIAPSQQAFDEYSDYPGVSRLMVRPVT